jgi:hypothetical protein
MKEYLMYGEDILYNILHEDMKDVSFIIYLKTNIILKNKSSNRSNRIIFFGIEDNLNLLNFLKMKKFSLI